MLNPEGSAFKVLLVDDDPAGRRMVSKALTRQGYRMTVAATPLEAWAKWDSEGPFDMLLADIHLAEGNGRDLARQLADRFPCLAVILCSGDPQESAEVLLKPFPIAALLTRMEVALRARLSAEPSNR